MKRHQPLSGMQLAACLVIVIGGTVVDMIACGPSTPASKTATTVATTLVDDACKVLEAESDATWVTLVCAAEGAASSVLVKLPRAQYNAMRVARADAGPGK